MAIVLALAMNMEDVQPHELKTSINEASKILEIIDWDQARRVTLELEDNSYEPDDVTFES